MRFITSTTVHDVELRVAGGRARGWVDVMTTEVFCEVFGFLEWEIGEVLVAEGYNLALCYIEGKLILTGRAKGAELDTLDLGTNGWCKVKDFRAGREEVFQGRVGILAVFVVLEGLEGSILLFRVPCWKVFFILLISV